MKAVHKAVPAASALLCAVIAIPLLAQSNQQSDYDQSWRSTLNLQDQAETANPTRVTQSHQVEEGRTVDVQTLEAKGINGGTQLYGQTQTETLKVNATTTRITTRHYITGPEGNKVLNSVTVEEKRELPDGGQSVVRSDSSPDANGALQVTRREVQETSRTAPDVRTTNTTLFLPSPNGGFAPSVRTHEVQKQVQPGTTEYTRSVSLQDGSGNWQVNEIRQGTIEKAGDTETKRESVSRLNADGKMALAEKTLSKETRNDGEQHKQVQTFSTSMNGVTAYPDGQMHLDREVTTVTRTNPGGQQVTTESVDQRSQASPSGPLRPGQRTLDITSTGLEGVKQQTVTIESASPNGGMETVWVDTKATTGAAPVTVDTSKPAAQKPATPPPQ
jgi:hypothetical protein